MKKMIGCLLLCLLLAWTGCARWERPMLPFSSDEVQPDAEGEMMISNESHAPANGKERRRMVMVDGRLYGDTGEESRQNGRCGVMDGQITSSVPDSEVPTQNDQSNFGTGFSYQYTEKDTIELLLDGVWMVFQAQDTEQGQVRFGDRMVDAKGLSEETLAWLEWYNNLTEQEQEAVSAIPPELLEEAGPGETQDAQPDQPAKKQ